MNRKFNPIKIKLFYPYICFNNCQYVFRKIKDLNEIEAIILSYIYCHNNQTINFIENYNKTFNLDDKWNNFTLNIVENLIKDNVLKTSQKPKYSLLSDFEINDEIKQWLQKNQFKGLEKKDITKTFDVHKSIYDGIHDSKKCIVGNNNAINLNFKNDYKWIIDREWEHYELVLKEKANDFKNDSNLAFIKINKDLKDYEILFHNFDKEIEIEIVDGNLIFSSADKEVYEYLEWLYKQNSGNVVIASFEKQFNLDIELDNVNSSEQYEYIKPNQYDDYFKSINKLSFYKEKNLFIENNEIFELKQKVHNICLINNQNQIQDQLALIVKTYYKKVDDFMIELLKEKYYDNAFEILKSLDKKQIKETINYLKSHYEFLENNELSKYKNWIIENILIDGAISNDILELCLNSNNINKQDIQKIALSNGAKIKEIITKDKISIIDESIINQKLISLLLDLQINILETELESSLKKKINDFTNKLKSLESNDEINAYNLEKEFSIIKQDILKLSDNNKLILGWFENQIKRIENSLEIKKSQDHINLKALILELGHKLDEISDEISNDIGDRFDNKGVEKLLDGELKEKWKEARQFRNSYVHSNNKDIQLPNKNEIEKIMELSNKTKVHMNWLNENKNKIVDKSSKSFESSKEDK